MKKIWCCAILFVALSSGCSLMSYDKNEVLGNTMQTIDKHISQMVDENQALLTCFGMQRQAAISEITREFYKSYSGDIKKREENNMSRDEVLVYISLSMRSALNAYVLNHSGNFLKVEPRCVELYGDEVAKH